jgi:putative toxin-antitoxin system antitoxin component (TIGR02293 family)
MSKTYDRETFLKFVEEPMAYYGQAGATQSFTALLTDKFKMVKVIQEGLSYAFFDRLKALFTLSTQDWSDYLDLSPKSLQRYQKEQRRFKAIHSEKILELAEVMVTGMEVFGDGEKLRLWMETPSLALGHQRPLDLIRNSYGKELVMRELMALEHGIFA